MVSKDKAHAELIMNMDPGYGEAFQAKTLVSKFHNKVICAVSAFWIYAAADPVELLPSVSRMDSPSIVVPVHPRISYLEKTKLPSFWGDVTKYPEFKAQFQALTQEC